MKKNVMLTPLAPLAPRWLGALLPLAMAGCSVPLSHSALDLTPFAAILSAVGVLYWLVTAAALLLAAMRPKTARGKGAALLVVVALFGYLPITDGWEIYKARSRLAKAEAMFAERCKTAGEKIHRTVENVEGIFLMKIRPKETNYGDQFKMDDPYGRDLGGQGYIETFVRGSYELMRPKDPRPGWPSRHGYRYVEAIDPKDGKRYRYTGGIKEVVRTSSLLIGGDGSRFTTKEFVLDKVPASDPAPRYGVTYDDISTREEREVWIAGSSLKVIDQTTNEIMAERIGYMMDRGQGATGGGRAPWLLAAANACPDFHRFPNPVVVVSGADAQPRQAQDFVEKVLKPILEN